MTVTQGFLVAKQTNIGQIEPTKPLYLHILPLKLGCDKSRQHKFCFWLVGSFSLVEMVERGSYKVKHILPTQCWTELFD